MRLFLSVVLFFVCSSLFAQQKKSLLQIHCNAPKILTTGEKIELPVSITHQLTKENTGIVTVELFNTATNTSVDGWFLNVFPLQYFTSIQHKTFTAKFPITVPMDYTGKIKIFIKASCANATDSVSFIIPVQSKKILHE